MSTPASTVETFEFKAEARQLLKLVVHSIYSNKDIFLRELISNSSDALDRLRLESFRNKELAADLDDLHVMLEVDSDSRTLTVRDNGIGMSREEVVRHIGTLAKSGTVEFLRRFDVSKESSADFIGQFGVGFYSTFMVADKVTLVTRRPGESFGTRWQSVGEGTYTIAAVEDAPQGTSVTLQLKPVDNEDHLFDYTDPHTVRGIVRQHSDFVTWPIRLSVTSEPSGEDDEGDDAEVDADSVIDAGSDQDEDTESAQPAEPETINSMKALWTRDKSEVSDEEYAEFYRQIGRGWDEPLEVIRVQAEGTFEYQALLFIPRYAPADMFTADSSRGLRLYVKRVHVMDNCEPLIPSFLRFLSGVVDAQDLSLNVSRESLQYDRHIHLMRKRLVKKVLASVKDMMAGDDGRYQHFWREFGRVVKEGLLNDFDNRQTILDIASFESTHSPDGMTTLREYVDRMKDGQDSIYYLTGDSRAVVENSPHIEAFQKEGIEVLLLTDPIDEMWVTAIREFDGKPLQSVAKGEVDLDNKQTEDEQKPGEHEEQEESFGPMLAWMADKLAAHVTDVRLSSRLTNSAACLVGGEYDMTPTLEKMYRAMGREVPTVKRALELNPTHPLVANLRQAHAERGEDAELVDIAELVYGMALLSEGGELTDPARFTRQLGPRLAKSF